MLLSPAMIVALLSALAVALPAQPSASEDVLIFGLARSGTTLIGSVYDFNPDVFYLFEPLHTLTNDALLDSATLSDLFDCRFGKFTSMFDIFWPYARRHMLWFWREFGTRKDYDQFSLSASDIQRIEQICRASPIHVIKEIHPLVRSLAEPSVMLVHALRDPIRVFNSWFVHQWITLDSIGSLANEMCNHTALALAMATPTVKVYSDATIDAVALYKASLPGYSIAYAVKWQDLHRRNVDMHSGTQYDGPHPIMLDAATVETIRTTPMCRIVLSHLREAVVPTTVSAAALVGNSIANRDSVTENSISRGSYVGASVTLSV